MNDIKKDPEFICPNKSCGFEGLFTPEVCPKCKLIIKVEKESTTQKT
jgi:hypothetical protein